MPNKERMYEARDTIEANLHRWYQGQYSNGTVNPNATSWEDCTAAFCFAGWGAVLSGWAPLYYDWDKGTMGTFIHRPQPAEYWEAHDILKNTVEIRGSAFEIGKEWFELTTAEADFLFVQTSSVDDWPFMRGLIEAIANGGLENVTYEQHMRLFADFDGRYPGTDEEYEALMADMERRENEGIN